MRRVSTYRSVQDAPQASSRQVLFRIIFRLAVLAAFASFGSAAFGKAFAALLTMSAIFCAIVAVMRREAMFGQPLTHWDEAATYVVLGYVIAALA
jgi:ABC-type microcin C transport system permease subunit YejB